MNGQSPAFFVSEVNSGHRESRRVVMVTAVGVWVESRITLQSKQFKINQKSSADLCCHGDINKHLCSWKNLFPPKHYFLPLRLCHREAPHATLHFYQVQIGLTGSAGGSGWAETMGGAKSFRSVGDGTTLTGEVPCTAACTRGVRGPEGSVLISGIHLPQFIG